MSLFAIGKTYRFNTTAPTILGSIINNARLIGIIDYAEAMSHEPVNIKYRTIRPLLPEGTPDDPESSIYYRFLSESGEKIILADLWINDSTIELIEHINFQVTFNNTSLTDISVVRDLLHAAGYGNFTIRQV